MARRQGKVALIAAAGLAAAAGTAAGTACAQDVRYGPGDRLHRGNHLDTIHARNTTLDEARANELAAYRGVEGARLAHRIHGRFEAERLDGACEPAIHAAGGETLNDIADLCDVSVATLVAYNPDAGAPNHAQDGALIFIPQANDLNGPAIAARYYAPGGFHEASAGGGAIEVSTVHHVQQFDTLALIAHRYQVSAARLANLNPQIDWNRLKPGVVRLQLPERSAADRTADAPSRNAVAAPSAKSAAKAASAHLSVSARAVSPGEFVTLSADGFAPGERVAVFRGSDRRHLKAIDEVVVGPDGAVRVSASAAAADLGGVIFAASNGETTLYSPRVSVVKISNRR
ncbi:MAG: LysM domain-containing protein [Pseudomonadota bacterium]